MYLKSRNCSAFCNSNYRNLDIVSSDVIHLITSFKRTHEIISPKLLNFWADDATESHFCQEKTDNHVCMAVSLNGKRHIRY